jgi:hypothetical protein
MSIWPRRNRTAIRNAGRAARRASMNTPSTGGMRQSSTAVIPSRHAHAVVAVVTSRWDADEVASGVGGVAPLPEVRAAYESRPPGSPATTRRPSRPRWHWKLCAMARRSDDRRDCTEVRRASESSDRLASPIARARRRRVWRERVVRRAPGGLEVAARQDRPAGAGERFFGRRARPGVVSQRVV